ncbi:Fc.00g011860.m01.CDS01 [Cosmosporella sp. VM-42]
MYTTPLALAIAPLVLLARADVSFDRDDVPNACNTICDPIVELSRQCDVDLRSDNDRDENLLEVQCVCTNDSFDVANIAALCADCIRQNQGNNNDDDDDDDDDDKNEDLKDISDLMYTCGFASTTYAASASASAQSISVSADRLTDITQLSTTIVPGQTSGGSNSGSSGSSVTTTASDGSSNEVLTTISGSVVTATDVQASTTSTDNAAPAMTPFGIAGMVVAGAAILLA